MCTLFIIFQEIMPQAIYRSKAPLAQPVDPTLFGVNRNRENNPCSHSNQGASTSPIILTASQLEKMKKRASGKPDGGLLKSVFGNRHSKEKQSGADERKNKMLALAALADQCEAKDDNGNCNLTLSASQARLKKIREEELDVVKHLKALAAQAEAFTLRDRQMENKRMATEKSKKNQSKNDCLVAESRQLELDGAYAEAEKLASAKREAREALAAQMQAIEEKRKIERKEREEEGLALLAQFQSYEDQDATIQREKKTQMANLREDILRANAEAIEARTAALKREKEEMAELFRYQKLKDAELEAREKEKAARVHAKKMWQMQILFQQEKGRSDKARLEERRLLRAAEMKEAATCRLEQENALRRKQETLALKKELLRQAQAKKMRAEEDAFAERLETEVNDSYEDKIKNQELAEQAKKASLNKSHLEALKHQVQEAESRRRAERARRFEEGRKLKMKAEEELATLEGIRGRLIEGLEAKGVASKYLANIRRAKLTPV